jgi:hypothetical protein
MVCSLQRKAIQLNIISAFKQAAFIYSIVSDRLMKCIVSIEWAIRLRCHKVIQQLTDFFGIQVERGF